MNNLLNGFNNSLRPDFTHLMPPYQFLPLPTMHFETRVPEMYNQGQIKRFADTMRISQKMQQINRKKGKYKRSTNNCHKKYIGIIKNLVCLKMANQMKEEMLNHFYRYRNSRVYYFIILSYMKWYLSPWDIRWVFERFCMEVSSKIQRYKLEINITNNSNFVQFRGDQIIQMDFSIQSITIFLIGREEEAMRILYQKHKYIIVKKNQYLKAIQIIKDLRQDLQKRFQEIDIDKKQRELRLEEVYKWKQIEIPNIEKLKVDQEEEYQKARRSSHKMDKTFKAKQEFEENQGSEQEEEEESNPSQNFQGQQQSNSVIIKEQQKIQSGQKSKYPLLELKDSFPVIDHNSWCSWLLQKQKRLEFYITSKEERMNNINGLRKRDDVNGFY